MFPLEACRVLECWVTLGKWGVHLVQRGVAMVGLGVFSILLDMTLLLPAVQSKLSQAQLNSRAAQMNSRYLLQPSSKDSLFCRYRLVHIVQHLGCSS